MNTTNTIIYAAERLAKSNQAQIIALTDRLPTLDATRRRLGRTSHLSREAVRATTIAARWPGATREMKSRMIAGDQFKKVLL